MLGPNQLLSINTHSGLNVLGLCCCPKVDPGGVTHSGGSNFEQAPPRRKRINPFLRVRTRRRAHGAVVLPVQSLERLEGVPIDVLPAAPLARAERYVPSGLDYELSRYFLPDQELGAQSSSNLLEVMPQLPAVSDEAALLALIALGLWDADDCC